MKTWAKILFRIAVVTAILFSASYIFILLRGKAIIIKRVGELTHKKVTIGYFDLKPPFNIVIKNLNIEGLVNVDSIFISPSIPSLLTGKIALNNAKIIKPEFTFERNAVGQSSGPAVSVTESPVVSAAPAAPLAPSVSVTAQRKLPRRLTFKRLSIKDGKINLIDHTAGKDGIKITLKNINFNLNNLYMFPSTTITNFDLKGNIPWEQGKEEGKINVEGWINFAKKDMLASLKIEGIDGIYLYPYYSNWVDLEKARIESASLSFNSSIQALNNNVTADCHLELTDIVRKPRAPEESAENAEKITDAVLDIFKTMNQGKVVLDFTIRTKMDRPEFGFGNIKMAFEEKLSQARASSGFKPQDVLMFPGKLLEGGVKGMTDFSKAVIDGIFAVGNELKKAVKDTVVKAPKPEPQKK